MLQFILSALSQGAGQHSQKYNKTMLDSLKLLDVVCSFPSAIPTVLLLAALFYWVLALIGLVDLDVLHGHGADIHHSIGSAHHGVDVHHGADGHHSDTASHGLLAGALLSMGLTGVPLSMVLSVMILTIWVVTTLLHVWFLADLPAMLRWGLGVPALVLGTISSLPLTAVLLRPMRGLFVVHNAQRDEHLVGHPCRILTLEVTERFGQAHVQDRGNGFTVRVFARVPNTLTKGSEAVLIAYDRATGRFEVAALTDLATDDHPPLPDE